MKELQELKEEMREAAGTVSRAVSLALLGS